MDDHQDMRLGVGQILDSLVTCIQDLQSIILDFTYFRAILSETQSRLVFRELSTADWLIVVQEKTKEFRNIYYIGKRENHGRIIVSGIIRNFYGISVSVYYMYYYSKSIKDCWARQKFDFIEWILESDPDLYSKMLKMQAGSRNIEIDLNSRQSDRSVAR